MGKRTPVLSLFILLTFLGILVLVYFIVSPFFPRNSSDAKELKQQVTELQEENNKLKADAKEVEEENNKLKADVKKLKKENKKLTKQLEDMKTTGDGYLISLLFKKAKFPYEMRDKSFEFYSDPSCEETYLIKEDLTFTGWQDYPIPDPDSGEISCYISNSNEKGVVFSKPEDDHPMFNAIK